MHVVDGRNGSPSVDRTGGTFSGRVWGDAVLPAAAGVTINSVVFEPGARTNWHRHERGQVLCVSSGAGLVCSRGGSPVPVRPGDVVFFEPGEEHWHGAGAGTLLVHLAISLGTTEWLEPVSDRSAGAAA
jgi:quercetin dioxygenase-like cupin family protein